MKEINKNDLVYTPINIVKEILSQFALYGFVLDSCSGENMVWYNSLSVPQEKKDWCEISLGRDFFNWDKKVDWIVGNPPYSNFDKFLSHSFQCADNVLYLVPFAKIFKSWGIIKFIRDYGGIVKVWVAPASICGFPFGFPVGAFHFKKGYSGQTEFIYSKHEGKTRFEKNTVTQEEMAL